MENTEPKKLGGALLTVTIINLVIYALASIGYIFILLSSNSSNETLKNALASTNTTQIAVNLILSIILLISLVLILSKKSIGVYIYFIDIIITIVYSIALNGFKSGLLASFILPILMLIFIFLKKDVFWNNNIIE
ncbi:MAG: hypothetical protein ABF633_01825 [Clostridium sp.]|uniref:hypothetical protein n=1 Tax=Clostridium sp. TaxID=1506 RepID=UPI0039E88EC9